MALIAVDLGQPGNTVICEHTNLISRMRELLSASIKGGKVTRIQKMTRQIELSRGERERYGGRGGGKKINVKLVPLQTWKQLRENMEAVHIYAEINNDLFIFQKA